jgi:VWFA-related protein
MIISMGNKPTEHEPADGLIAIAKHAWRVVAVLTAATLAVGSLAAQSTVFKSDVREVSVVFRVVDKENQSVSGITPADIQIDDQGISRKITSFQGDIAHSQVVILADVSGSMATVLEPLQKALYTFADIVSKDSDREPGDVLLSLIPFGDSATMLVDRTPNPMEFKKAVARLVPSGSTALVDSVMAALLNAFGDKDIRAPKPTEPRAQDDGPIPSRYRPPRASAGSPSSRRSKFLVIFTDAGENSSSHQWSEIASAMLGRDVVIYSVEFDSGSPDSNFSMMSKIALQSGGKVYRAKADNLEPLYSEIAKDIRSHYELTFSAADVENPRIWRNISLRSNRPGVTILARAGYCPETPCQKADGSFVGGQPKTWNDVLAMSRDPRVILSVRRRLQDLKLEYTAATEKIIKDLGADPLLIEKVWKADGKRPSKDERAGFISRRVDARNRLVSIDAEVCGITVNPSQAPLTSANERALTVADPEIRIARKPGSANDSSAEGAYFQSQAIFYLEDHSGRIPSRIRVQCNRPHFLIGDDLVQLAVQALEYGLKVQSRKNNGTP